MKKTISIILVLTCVNLFVFAQKAENHLDKTQIKQKCIGFLKWYKQNSDSIETSPLIKGFNSGPIKKDSVLRVDMNAVESYLTNFKQPGYVSYIFLNDIKLIYKRVSDTLTLHPVNDYFGPVPSLESDVIFGFGKDEILDSIDKGRFEKFYIMYNKAMVKLKLSYTTKLIFTLTKANNTWLIDYIGFDGNSKFNIGSQ